jgi:primosomal replication protein N
MRLDAAFQSVVGEAGAERAVRLELDVLVVGDAETQADRVCEELFSSTPWK